MSDDSIVSTGIEDSVGGAFSSAFDAPADFEDADFDPPAAAAVAAEAEDATSDEAAPDAVEAAVADDAETDTEPAIADEAKKAAADAVVAAAAAKKARQLTFTGEDGKPVALAETSVIEHKVDGKPAKVPLKDLIENYAGKVAWDRRLQEVAVQRKEVAEKAVTTQKQIDRHRSLITDMHKNVLERKTFAAVQNMLDMTGAKVDARQYMTELREQVVAQAQELDKMSPEQRALYEQQEQFNYSQEKHNREVQQYRQEQTEKEFHGRVAKAIETAGTSTEEFVQTADFMRQAYAKTGRDPATITPEDVAEQISSTRDWKLVQDAMNAVDPELVKDQNLWKDMVEMSRSNKWTQKDLEEIFQKAVSEKRSKALSNKVAKSPRTPAAASAIKAKTAAAKQRISDPNNWDDVSEADTRW